MGLSFEVPFLTEERDRAGFCPFALSQVSVRGRAGLGTPALPFDRCSASDKLPADTIFGALPSQFIPGDYKSHNKSTPIGEQRASPNQ
ncbi:hypothetical protein TNCT_545911 [Trichonephila clavata]|uniref:Uncharacterized protein n=1 Tax=Trichonephila clavata TaxID=2740835 RepID=A0A8X6FM90_TRICU|nr:hypothetical protein TNCT_545911 [Trichonephila clavata]